jgi:hypothetical protein
VTLTAEEREHLQAMIAASKAAAKALAHARILLKADEADGGPAGPGMRTHPRRPRARDKVRGDPEGPRESPRGASRIAPQSRSANISR